MPTLEIEGMHREGLLAAVLPVGADRAPVEDPATLVDLLVRIGAASLTVGRLYEGHVNAAKLIATYGNEASRHILRGEITSGRLLGVWNAERGEGPRLTRRDKGWSLTGRKVHCSGAGHIRRPVVTARTENGDVMMLLPDLMASGVAIDVGVWRAAGMRGTATGTVTFDDVRIADDAVLGAPGDYYRSPWFSGGAWRVLAVQLGGLQRILALHAERLLASGRADAPVFRARFADAASTYDCARLLVREAAQRAENPNDDPQAIDAYVDHARSMFEHLALTGIAAARRNVGLASFIAPDPLDRCIRDLETYLRQPFVDASRDNSAAWLLPRSGRFK